jgi:hypothetical protein
MYLQSLSPEGFRADMSELCVFFNKLFLTIQFWFWYRNHTLEDLETRLLELGCTRVYTRDSIIFTTPNKKGKIVITENDIWINPK